MEEIESQPRLWRLVAARATELSDALPPVGARIAIVGCGTSYYIGNAFAAARESLGRGESDAFIASEARLNRRYDSVVIISRSGTTTEVLRVMERLTAETETVAISAMPHTPIVREAHKSVVLDFADEESIVQTRFATTTLAMLRAHLAEDLEAAFRDGEEALSATLPVEPTRFDHYVFLARGWAVGVAQEAALKLQEMASARSEAYPAMEYRHGPISAAGPRTAVWPIGAVDADLLLQVARTGAHVVKSRLDPMAELIAVQRVALALAEARGLDPGNPKYLTRSVQVS